eukprot:1380210-Rhodomonas_salina.1
MLSPYASSLPYRPTVISTLAIQLRTPCAMCGGLIGHVAQVYDSWEREGKKTLAFGGEQGLVPGMMVAALSSSSQGLFCVEG